MRKADSPVPAAPIDQKSPSRGNNGANDHDDNPNSSDEPQASGKKKSGDKNGPTASPTDDHAGSAASNDGTSTLKPEKQDRHATGVQ
jgi:hypothetical protein